MRRVERSQYRRRLLRPGEPEPDDDLRETTAAERLAMMWQFALEAWAERITVAVEGLEIPVIGQSHLIPKKRATGRP